MPCSAWSGFKARIAAALRAGCEIEVNLYLAGSLWIVQAEAGYLTFPLG
jgi:hypothetical protein